MQTLDDLLYVKHERVLALTLGAIEIFTCSVSILYQKVGSSGQYSLPIRMRLVTLAIRAFVRIG